MGGKGGSLVNSLGRSLGASVTGFEVVVQAASAAVAKRISTLREVCMLVIILREVVARGGDLPPSESVTYTLN